MDMKRKGKIATTQDHLDIEDVRDDIVLLKSNNATAVLQTTAVNFDLLSEGEQDSMIFAYASLLNSLSFPIQVVVRTKRMDVSNYLYRIQEAKNRATNDSIATQIDLYEAFIEDLVSKNQVLDKRFYVVVPYIGLDFSQIKGGFSHLFGRRVEHIDRGALLEKAKSNLEPKIEHLSKQFARIGIKVVRLNTEELVELFYDLYNPEVAREQKAALGTREYTTPLVEPSIAPMIGAADQPVINQATTDQLPTNPLNQEPQPMEEQNNPPFETMPSSNQPPQSSEVLQPPAAAINPTQNETGRDINELA